MQLSHKAALSTLKALTALSKTVLLFNLIFIFYMVHCNGYLCLKLLYYNYENKDFFWGSFCSQYHNLQVSNLIIYDTCVPVGLGGFLMFCFAFNNKTIT